jgi:aspartokinase
MQPGEDTMHQAIGILKEHRIRVDLILTSRSTITIAIDNAPARELDEALKELNVICEAKLKSGFSKVSLVGKSINSLPGINARILSSVKDLSINAVLFGGSGNSESFLVKQEDAEKAIRQLHREFF